MSRVALGTIAEVVAGQSPEGKFYNGVGDGVPFYQGKKGFGEKFIEPATVWTTQVAKLAKAGDILMSVRAPVGPVNFATEEICIGRGLAAIRSKSSIDRDFLFYQLLYLQPQIAGSEGAVFASINKAQIEALPIVAPALPDQQRIVGILDEAFAGIAAAKANAEKNLRNARAFFESHLASVLSEQGDGWSEKRLDQLAHERCSLSYGIVQPGEQHEGGLPIVRPTDLGTNVIRLYGLKRVDPAVAKAYQRTTLVGGELLLCVRGDTGVVSIAHAELAGGNVTRGIVPIRFDDTQMSQAFGYYALTSDPVQRQIRAKTYGAALMQINIRDLREIMVPVPPRAEQERISKQMDAVAVDVQRLESIYHRKLAALDELKQSLLHRAFSGQL